MENEIIKQTFKLGNSAGVILPIEWNGKKVSIKLIERSIQSEILEILENNNLIKNTIAILLTGSYSRGEETELSDIDILVITNSIDKQIKKGKYDITLISRDKFEKFLEKSIYLISLINEAKAILNEDFLSLYKNKSRNISFKKKIGEIKSMTKINEEIVKMDEELGEKISDETIYSLVLRLRELYLINCLKENKIPTTKDFLKIMDKIQTSECYNSYKRIKNDLKSKKIISSEEAKRLIEEIRKRIHFIENGKKN